MTRFGASPPRRTGPVPGPTSRRLARRLHQVESRNVLPREGALVTFWDEALGVNVRDSDGNVLLDLTGAFGVALAGHRHPRIVEALERGGGRLIHGMGDVQPSRERLELLEHLSSLSPWRSCRGVLSSSGSEAVETALKTAFLATGRPGILAFQGVYHGLTMGALATTHREHFRGPFRPQLSPHVAFAPFPVEEGEVGEKDVWPKVDQLLDEGTPDGIPVGAVVVEPIQGRAGVRVPPPGFLSKLAERTRRAGALLILDEIFTGLGRTGRIFALEEAEVIPDLLCLGKGLGGGLPLSACLGPEEVMDAWPPSQGEAVHTSTFLGHPLACRTGKALLEVLEEEELPDRARDTGRLMAQVLAEEIGNLGPRVRVRGRGLFLGVTFHDSNGVEPLDHAGVQAAEILLSRGIITLPAGARGEVLELTPPLVLDPELARYAALQVTEVAGLLVSREG